MNPEPTDLVTTLRLWSDNAKDQDAIDIVVGLCAAADEIERLRRDYSCICNEMRRMMEERDEARRMYLASTCSDDEIIPEMKRRGWDCFKEANDDR